MEKRGKKQLGVVLIASLFIILLMTSFVSAGLFGDIGNWFKDLFNMGDDSELEGELGSLKVNCVDSDGGIEIYEKGFVTYYSMKYSDRCIGGSAVNEYYCENNLMRIVYKKCDDGCVDGACVGGCVAKTCSELGKECGSWDDGCNGTIDCGSCSEGESCVDGSCVADCIPQTCSELGKECESWDDGCENLIDCGECGVGESCVGGSCVVVSGEQLIAHWSFDSDSNDESGNNNNGVLQRGALVSDRVLNLDGVDDYMSVASSDLMNINQYDEASFSFWINPNGWGANDRSDLYRDSLSKTGFSLFGAGEGGYKNIDIVDVPLNEWTHFLINYRWDGDSVVLDVYQNKVLDVSIDTGVGRIVSSSETQFGGCDTGCAQRHFKGMT